MPAVEETGAPQRSTGETASRSFKKTGETRIFPVDVLRGIAISVVVYLHLGFFAFGAPLVLSPILSWHVSTNGYYGVSIFFVISGFLITRYIIARDNDLGFVNLRDFYVRRVSRIAPGFILIIVFNFLLFALAVPGFTWDTAAHPIGPYLFYLLTFRANVYRNHFGTFSLPLDPLWSLAVEEVFYIFYPLICRALRKTWLIVVFLGAFVVIGPIYRHVSPPDTNLYGYFACFDLLALGCLTAVAEWHFNGNARARAMARPLQRFGAAALAISYLGILVNEHRTIGPTIVGLSAATFIAGSAFLTDAAERSTTAPTIARFLSHLGSLSYEVYLFHMAVFVLIAGAYHALASGSGLGWLLNASDVAFIILIGMFSALGTQLAAWVLDPARRQLRRALLLRGHVSKADIS